MDQIKETIYHQQLENGLKVYLLPKEGFNKTYATFTTKYGSIDHHFKLPGSEAVQVPDGIAHFLEHKLFEKEEGDIFQQFSMQGAQCNAFTSFTRTAYLFSATQLIEQNLITLLDFVQSPYFTEETVEKEKGIIEQEINMYLDNPAFRNYFGLLEALYQKHPVKIDIAGTVGSIRQITKDMLYTCYQTFYHPSNMLLFVVGAIHPEQTMTLIKENQNKKGFEKQQEIIRFSEEEPSAIAQKVQVVELSVDTPKCLIGFKEKSLGLTGKVYLQQEAATELLLDMLFGPTTLFYQQLMDERLIDENFDTGYTLESGFGFSVVGGNTPNPERLYDKIQNEIERVKQEGLSEVEFERTRKKHIGAFLKQLNHPEYMANQFTQYAFNETNMFDLLPILEALTFEDVVKRFDTHLDLASSAMCVVK